MVGNKKKKKVKEPSRFDDVPQYLKDFIDHVALKERPDEENERRRASSRRKKEVVKEKGLSFKTLTSGVASSRKIHNFKLFSPSEP